MNLNMPGSCTRANDDSSRRTYTTCTRRGSYCEEMLVNRFVVPNSKEYGVFLGRGEILDNDRRIENGNINCGLEHLIGKLKTELVSIVSVLFMYLCINSLDL